MSRPSVITLSSFGRQKLIENMMRVSVYMFNHHTKSGTTPKSFVRAFFSIRQNADRSTDRCCWNVTTCRAIICHYFSDSCASVLRNKSVLFNKSHAARKPNYRDKPARCFGEQNAVKNSEWHLWTRHHAGRGVVNLSAIAVLSCFP